MYGLVLLGFSTVAALWQVFRLSGRDHQDQDFHEDRVLQSDPSRIHYYESYPNLSTSTSTTTTKNFHLQSENVNNNSTEEIKPTPLPDQTRPLLSQSSSSAKAKPLTNASQSGLSLDNPPSSKSTLSQLQSESSNNKSREGTKPTPSSDQSKPVLSQSSSEKSNQPRSSSVKAKSTETESQSPSSFKKPSSSKLTFSPLPSNSRNRHTKNNSKQVVQQGTSPSCMIPKDTENLIKKEIVAEVLKTLLCLAANKDYFAAPCNAEDFSDEYHKRAKPSVMPILELNFLGLPIRPGEKDCPNYMSTGLCKYEANCMFNHPNPTAEGDSDSPSAYHNGGSVSSKDASQASVGFWSSPRTLNETSPMISPLQNSEWNGYQDQDLHAIANQASERKSHTDSSFESHASNFYATSSVHDSSRGDSTEPPCQLDRSRIYYHERYPNVSNSTSSTKTSELQSEYGNNKSVERTKPPLLSPNLSKPVLSQSSSITSDEPRSSYAEAKPTPTKSQSPSSLKPSLSPLSSNSTNQPTKANYKQVVKDTSPICTIPKDIENLIKKGVVPNVFKKPLSQSTYKDYFAALLYAEDFYIEVIN